MRRSTSIVGLTSGSESTTSRWPCERGSGKLARFEFEKIMKSSKRRTHGPRSQPKRPIWNWMSDGAAHKPTADGVRPNL